MLPAAATSTRSWLSIASRAATVPMSEAESQLGWSKDRVVDQDRRGQPFDCAHGEPDEGYQDDKTRGDAHPARTMDDVRVKPCRR